MAAWEEPAQAFVLVRHGETEWSAEGRHTSRSDVPLTAKGLRQAEMVGARLGRRRFKRVMSSPLGRALETCRLAGFGESVELRDELREWDYGDYEGRTTADIRRERPTWTLWFDGAPGGESASDVGRRADRLIEDVRATDGDVLAFAHAHVLRVIGARWAGLPAEEGRLLALSTATISVLSYERETAVVLSWNEDVAPPEGGTP